MGSRHRRGQSGVRAVSTLATPPLLRPRVLLPGSGGHLPLTPSGRGHVLRAVYTEGDPTCSTSAPAPPPWLSSLPAQPDPVCSLGWAVPAPSLHAWGRGVGGGCWRPCWPSRPHAPHLIAGGLAWLVFKELPCCGSSPRGLPKQAGGGSAAPQGTGLWGAATNLHMNVGTERTR